MGETHDYISGETWNYEVAKQDLTHTHVEKEIITTLTNEYGGLDHLYHHVKQDISLYYPELPYHNISHAQEVTLRSLLIAHKLGTLHLFTPLIYAGWFHDAGYSVDHTQLGFTSKEDYSIYLFTQYAQDRGLDDELLQQVINIIDATKLQHKTFTHEGQKIIRAADTHGLGIQSEQFTKNTQLICQEAQQLHPDTYTSSLFKKGIIDALTIFVNSNNTIPSTYFLIENYHQQSRKNLESLQQKTVR